MCFTARWEKEKKGGKKKEMVDLEKVHKKELCPAVEKFLKLQKNCLSEYVGTELSLKGGKPVSEQMCSMCQKESFYIQRKNSFKRADNMETKCLYSVKINYF